MACKCEGGFASKANNRITIQTPTTTEDNYGGRTTTWADLSTVWAIMTPKSGKEHFQSGQHQSRVDMHITIRYQSDLSDTAVSGKYRIKFGSRYLDIIAVRNVEEDMKTEGLRYQIISCVEGLPT